MGMRRVDGQPPLTREFIDTVKFDTFLAPLTAADLRATQEWIAAAMLVSTNDVKHVVNHARVVEMARARGQPVYVWANPLVKSPAGYLLELSLAAQRLLIAAFPALFVKFTRGCPAMLLDNVNPAACLANG